MKKIKTFLNNWGITIMFPMMVILFFKGCGTSSTVNNLETKTVELNQTVDSLNTELAKRPTLIGVRDEMEKVMLDYIIYENELDDKKITISQIKDKIEANDKNDQLVKKK